MKLIVGLGNTGKQYANTWHNLGFIAIDKLAALAHAPKSKKSLKFKAEVSEIGSGDDKIILAKPLTFMNLSGVAVASMAQFYKVKPKDIIVIHDDIDLALGKLRIAYDSSAGGHNGIKSIIESLGTKEFCRVKIGVADTKLKFMDAADYVLDHFDKQQEKIVGEQTQLAAEATLEITKTSPETAMNKYN